MLEEGARDLVLLGSHKVGATPESAAPSAVLVQGLPRQGREQALHKTQDSLLSLVPTLEPVFWARGEPWKRSDGPEVVVRCQALTWQTLY